MVFKWLQPIMTEMTGGFAVVAGAAHAPVKAKVFIHSILGDMPERWGLIYQSSYGSDWGRIHKHKLRAATVDTSLPRPRPKDPKAVLAALAEAVSFDDMTGAAIDIFTKARGVPSGKVFSKAGHSHSQLARLYKLHYEDEDGMEFEFNEVDWGWLPETWGSIATFDLEVILQCSMHGLFLNVMSSLYDDIVLPELSKS